MPYTARQHRTFQAIAHGFKPKKKGLRGISQGQASKMASEGVKKGVSGARRRHAVARGVRGA
jgi:hypothetical protein